MKTFFQETVAILLLFFATFILAIFSGLLPVFYLYRKIFGKYPKGIIINGEH